MTRLVVASMFFLLVTLSAAPLSILRRCYWQCQGGLVLALGFAFPWLGLLSLLLYCWCMRTQIMAGSRIILQAALTKLPLVSAWLNDVLAIRHMGGWRPWLAAQCLRLTLRLHEPKHLAVADPVWHLPLPLSLHQMSLQEAAQTLQAAQVTTASTVEVHPIL